MSISGGTADKLGGRYEARWTLNCVLRILAERADWIWVEPIGAEGEGIEFIFSRDGRDEHHQVKRQRTGEGHWTLAALRDAGVLANFKTILARGGNPRFISGHDAHELHELGDRARKASTLGEFRAEWLPKEWTSKFQTLSSIWDQGEAGTYDGLLRCDVITVGDDELDAWNQSLVEGLVEAPPRTALAALVDIVADRLQSRLDAQAFWDALAEPKYRLTRRIWAHASLRQQLDQLTRDYATPVEAVRLKHPIVRAEAEEAIKLLMDSDRVGVLLAGPAGAGKSDVIVQIVNRLRAEGWLALAFRVDRMTDTVRPEGLGEQLGLPGSPAAVLGAVAKGEPSILIVDQLDAVSLASGRLRRLWEPVFALLHQAQAQPRVRLLLACRQFDLNNDHRLRQLTADGGLADSVIVGALDVSQVQDAIRGMGGNPDDLNDRQLRLLELPLHLVLVEPLIEAGEALTFATAKELFDAYWARKRLTVEDRLDGIDWTGTLRFLAQRMSETRRLSLRKAEVEVAGHDRDASVLASEQVLVTDDRTIAFFHESFFDYTFARYYVAERRSVMDLLVDDEQDLFRRAQVRQILLHEREADPAAYTVDLRTLLDSTDIRFHLKQLVFALLADLPEPMPAELEVLTPILEGSSSDPRWWPSWRVIMTPHWFHVADETRLVEHWLTSEDATTVNAAVRVLGSIVDSFPRRVAELLKAADHGSDEWPGRRAFVVRMGNAAADRGLFDHLTQHALDLPLEGEDHDLWMYAQHLPSQEPTWAAVFLRVMLNRAQRRADAEGKPHPFDDANLFKDDYWADQFLAGLAASGPAELVDVALPWVLSVADADVAAYGSSTSSPDCLAVDRIWGYRVRNNQLGFKDALLASLCAALKGVASTEPDRFQAWARELAESPLEVAQFLLYEGVRGNPTMFGDWAVEQLLTAETRWRCGYNDDLYWVTHELLSDISPHISSASFDALEKSLVGWTPEWERSAEARQYRGHAEFTLLSALDPARQSETTIRRIGELQRKFERSEPAEPQGITGGTVVSPIDPQSAERMSDDDWIRAVVKHRESWEEKRDASLIGGARELAQTVQNGTQEDPARWVDIGLRLPANVLPVYYDHLLIGLAQPVAGKALAPADKVFELLTKVADLPTGVEEQYFVRLVARYADDAIPDDLVARVGDVAIEAKNPDRELWQTVASSGQCFYGGDPWHAGMNSTRGAAAEAIGRLVGANEARVDRLLPAIASLADDPSVAVRTCGAEAVAGLARWRRDLAVELLVRLVDTDDIVFTAQPVQQLIAAVLVTHSDALLPAVERMMASDVDAARQAGARLACLSALQEEGAGDLLSRCVEHSDPIVRRGAAQVAAANLSTARFTDRCRTALITLLDDDDDGVRDEAVRAFWQMNAEDLAGQEEVARSALLGKSYRQARQHVLYAIERSTADVSDLILLVAAKMLDEDVASLSDIREHIAGEAKDLGTLLVRVLGDRETDPLAQRAALDALDKLCAAGAWGIADALAVVDR